MPQIPGDEVFKDPGKKEAVVYNPDKLVRKGVEFILDGYCKSAFKTFTETLTSYPILR